MSTRVENTLNFLLWSVALLMRPTFRNMADSWEEVSVQGRPDRPVSHWQRHRWLRVDRQDPGSRLFRLTEPGRLRVLGGRDPQKCWSRDWDGIWRLIAFDVPIGHNARRERLRRLLRARGYGCLQGSVWITPDFKEGEHEILRQGDAHAHSLVALEARPCSGESDLEIVQCAWDFEQLNRLYCSYLNILDRRPKGPHLHGNASAVLRSWAEDERKAWRKAIHGDPLLPHCLHPPGYLGPDAFRLRQQALGPAGRAFLWGREEIKEIQPPG